jgi:DNA polymerase
MRSSLNELAELAKGCQACALYRNATQTVFGEGPKSADLVLVGEQPGDQEDLTGRPFVGPAGRLLDDLIAEAGIDRDSVYVTNAVKHFKWIPKGTRRIHQKPNRGEVVACHRWLDAELDTIQPKVVVCLGATAAQSMLGPAFRLTKHFGEWQVGDKERHILATLHPSALLRMPNHEDREVARRQLSGDLRAAFDLIGQLRA